MTALHTMVVPSRRSVAAVVLVLALLVTASPAMATTAGQVGPTGGGRKPAGAVVSEGAVAGGGRKPAGAVLSDGTVAGGFAGTVARLLAGIRNLL
ncbi:MAG TPA: hypothetical protein VK875_08925 [Euzebyales bacterium]|nr:hypothetical protein [Euzebyales bacterium]